jgi:thiol:disulfide interchange protein DsbD
VTFANAKVRRALAGDAVIRVDVTADTAASKALLQRFHLVGPPAFIRLDASGQVEKVQEGYLGPEAFLRWLDA